jgi:hypothetical protein
MGADVMSAKHRCNWDSSPKRPYLVNSLPPANVGRSRAALLAGASLVALAALAAPDQALAACSGHDQTISTSRTGPVHSNGGAITVTGSGSILGGPSGDAGGDGVSSASTITTLSNGGTISGGSGTTVSAGAGGVGVSNAGTITTLTNSGKINGGNGAFGRGFCCAGGAGGAGV